MGPHPDWNALLKDLEELHSLWLTKAQAAVDDKRWFSGVLFGIETGWNRIAEEVGKPNPNIGSTIVNWRQHLDSRKEAGGQEVVKGVDYGIQLTIDCVRRFFSSTTPHEPRRPAHPSGPNGDQDEEIS
jgi:hypothetical protein